jgi:Tol biopolymer transport system component
MGTVKTAGPGQLSRVSVSSTGAQATGYSDYPAMSADGRFVAFASAANLVPDDHNGVNDTFVRDRVAGTTELVSVSSSGTEGNRSSGDGVPVISADGRYVAFASRATNLVPHDTNRTQDVFIHDRLTGTTRRVSVSATGREANGGSEDPAISADGKLVAFDSGASNLVRGDTNHANDVFVRNLARGITWRVSRRSDETQGALNSFSPAISAHGRYVAFASGSALVRDDTNRNYDVYVRDRLLGTTQRVSVSSSEGQARGLSGETLAISPHGRFVAFSSMAADLVAGDTNRNSDVFLRDRRLGTTQRISVSTDGTQGNGYSSEPVVSAGGRYVAFTSTAALVPGLPRRLGFDQIFLRDLSAGTTELLSVDANNQPGGFGSSDPAMSPDGRFVAFDSLAANLVAGDTNHTTDVFVLDRTP